MDNAINNGSILEGGKLDEEDLTWTNGNLQREIWTPREEEKEKPELPSLLQMLEELLTVLSDDSPTEKVKIVPFEEDGKVGLRMVIRVPKE